MKTVKLVCVLLLAVMILALGLLVASVSGCADLGSLVPASPTYPPNGSSQYPYPVTVSKGPCTAWKIVYDGDEGNPFCAHTLPTQQVGGCIQLSYMGEPDTVCIVSIDVQRHVAYVR